MPAGPSSVPWTRSLWVRYEHLYLHEIDDGPALAEHVLDYARLYTETRPHDRTKRSTGSSHSPDTPQTRPRPSTPQDPTPNAPN